MIESYWLGLTPYEKTQNLVREIIQPAVKNTGKIIIIYTTHFPVLTLGNRVKINNLSDKERKFWKDKNVNILQTDRGGELTFHNQGQLMIYPILSLRFFKLSVRRFVEICLKSASRMLGSFGVNAVYDATSPGVWVGTGSDRKKIISSGFRIRNGLSEHGLALYVSKIAEEFSSFSPCGLSSDVLISLTDLKGFNLEISDVINTVNNGFISELTKELNE